MTADALHNPGVEAAQAGLAAARAARVPAPQPDPEGLRRAYLELLKLTLCDLTGSSTGAVVARPDGTVAAKELTGEEARLRAAGMDWPRYGLTMIGLHRLDDLQRCVEAVVRDGVSGDVIETGVWRGGASILMRATLDTLPGPERDVWVADSFMGFPQSAPAESDDAYLNAFEFLAASLDEVRENFARLGLDHGVRFVPGFFAETLPPLAGRRWSVIRLDGDTREATLVGLRSLYAGLEPGGYVVVDDYGAIEECRAAVDEFRAEHGITEPLEAVDWTCVKWRRESEQYIAPPPVEASGPGTLARPPARTSEAHIPTHEELDLRDRLHLARVRLEAAQAELDSLERNPLRGVARGLRRRARRPR